MGWYKANTSNGQGLVVDEKTGENIAVIYDEKNADIVAAAPEMLKALEMAERWHSGDKWRNGDASQKKAWEVCSQIFKQAIAKAKAK